MITLIVVIVDPIIYDVLYFAEVSAVADINLIFHMSEETLLRSIIPAIGSSGHRLPEIAVFYNFDEFVTCIMDSLVGMDNCFFIQRNPMVPD